MINNIILYFKNNIIVSFGSGAITTAIILLWCFCNLDKIERFFAFLYRTFSWISTKLEYGKIAFNIQAAVNNVGNEINNNCNEVLPYAMKIKWAKSAKDAEAFLRNGEIIITMDYSPNSDRNLVVSTLAYLEKGLLPVARPYIDESLMKATDYTVAKKIFSANYGALPMNYFLQNYLKPEIESDPLLQKDCSLLDNINEAGFLSTIYLRQIQLFGNKVYPSYPNPSIKKESRSFAAFLERIATRNFGEYTNLTFAHSRIRVHILLVAQEETKYWGTEAYLRRIKINLDRGIEYTYICARGSENVSLANEIAIEAQKAGHLKIITKNRFLQFFNNKELSSICIVCAMNLLTSPGYDIDNLSKLYRIIEENVKELNEGKVEIVAMATLPGIKSKIAVRSVIDNFNPIKCFTEQSLLNNMESILGGEKLEFIKWSNNPKSLIINSLIPLDPDKAIKIKMDLDRKQAIVVVDSWKSKRKALGRGDQNVACAMELTGWNISVVELKEKDSEKV